MLTFTYLTPKEMDILDECSRTADKLYRRLSVHRIPSGRITDELTIPKMAKFVNTVRQNVSKARDELLTKGLIESIPTGKPRVYRFKLPLLYLDDKKSNRHANRNPNHNPNGVHTNGVRKPIPYEELFGESNDKTKEA